MDETRLKLLRTQIDELDAELLTRLNKRAELAVQIGQAKGTTPAYDPEREGEVLRRIVSLSQGPLSKGSLEDIYAAIITACREIQIK